MTDYFAMLGEARRPWLEPESLKAKFLALSAKLHPDKTQTENRKSSSVSFAELNAAHNCLSQPRERLGHLLELELGKKPSDLQQMSPDWAELFLRVATVCRRADEFLAEKAKTTSPLLLAELFDKGTECADLLAAEQRALNQRNDVLVVRLKELDRQWTAGGDTSLMLGELEDLWRLFGFIKKWQAQLGERQTQIVL